MAKGKACSMCSCDQRGLFPPLAPVLETPNSPRFGSPRTPPRADADAALVSSLVLRPCEMRDSDHTRDLSGLSPIS